MNNDQKRMFLAIALSAAVLFIWQAYFAPKEQFKSQPVAKVSEQVSKAEATPVAVSPTTPAGTDSSSNTAVTPTSKEIKSFTVDGGKGYVSLTNNLGINDFSSEDAKHDFKNVVGESEAPFKLYIKTGNAYAPVFLEMVQEGSVIRGRNDEYGITFLGNKDEEGRFKYSLTSIKPVSYRFVFESKEKSLDNRQVRYFTFMGNKDVERFDVGDEDSFDGQMKWVGLDFNFHLFAAVFDKNKLVRAVNKNGILTVDFVEPTQSLDTYFVFVKKNYDLLTKLGDKLELSVDFGIFGILAVPILRGIQFVYKYIPNYGVGIILLTILLRIITFPLYYKSIVSMKKMQKVQPELTKLREKFKDDPQRMQKETMDLFKRAGANPLGGCFPMLLQMPIFFAFYQVLYNAVELVNAPFIGWIHDLSIKDPLYILPVAMAIAMFGQQKLTPTTSADPTQQKIMMAMPLVFGFIMKDLPSGLVLYIFVSTLFGILQQLLVYKATD